MAHIRPQCTAQSRRTAWQVPAQALRPAMQERLAFCDIPCCMNRCGVHAHSVRYSSQPTHHRCPAHVAPPTPLTQVKRWHHKACPELHPCMHRAHCFMNLQDLVTGGAPHCTTHPATHCYSSTTPNSPSVHNPAPHQHLAGTASLAVRHSRQPVLHLLPGSCCRHLPRGAAIHALVRWSGWRQPWRGHRRARRLRRHLAGVQRRGRRHLAAAGVRRRWRGHLAAGC